jgi:hypothetical protein
MTKHVAGTSLTWVLAITSGITALLLPAIWNGFPLVFADTGGYLERAFQANLEIGRSALYGAFLAAGISLLFWPNVIIQAAATLWISGLVFRVHGLSGRPGLAVLVVSGLSALTSLPWYAGQLMPDIFLPLTVLAIHLLCLRPWRIDADSKGKPSHTGWNFDSFPHEHPRSRLGAGGLPRRAQSCRG